MIRFLLFLFLPVSFIFLFSLSDKIFIPFGIITLILFIIDIVKIKLVDTVVIVFIWGLFLYFSYVFIMFPLNAMESIPYGSMSPGGEIFNFIAFFVLPITIILFLLTIYNQKINTFFKKNYRWK